jgi:hypothetical protein
MTTTRAEFDVHDMVRELTEPHEHREKYTTDDATGTAWTGTHRVPVPSLVDQLLHVTGAGPGSRSQSGTVPHSRPELSIEQHDLLAEMHRVAADWIRVFGSKPPANVWDRKRERPVRGSGTKARLRHLHGLMPRAKHCGGLRARWSPESDWCCQWHHIEFLLSGWWHRARVLLGWDPGAFRPHNSCPVCSRRGLVLDVDAEFGSCSHCPATFAGNDWRLLVMHIRIENDLTREDADA